MMECNSHPISIFIAGDYDTAVQTVANYCNETGFCVTVTRTVYVFTNGKEDGVVIGLINYPRFPESHQRLLDRATEIAERLIKSLNQESYSIQTLNKTYWQSYR